MFKRERRTLEKEGRSKQKRSERKGTCERDRVIKKSEREVAIEKEKDDISGKGKVRENKPQQENARDGETS